MNAKGKCIKKARARREVSGRQQCQILNVRKVREVPFGEYVNSWWCGEWTSEKSRMEERWTPEGSGGRGALLLNIHRRLPPKPPITRTRDPSGCGDGQGCDFEKVVEVSMHELCLSCLNESPRFLLPKKIC